jgi:MarR family transcriptional regulator, organic hydroperoxide resistance regulator
MRARRSTVSKGELLVDGSDATFRGFIHDFLAFAARVHEVRDGFGKAIGLSGPGYSTLISIAHLEEEHGVGVNRVAEHLHVSGAFITVEVAKLVRAGLVTKRPNAADKRRVLLTITNAGRSLLDELAPVQAPVNDTLFEALGAEEFLALKTTIGKLVGCGDRALALIDYRESMRSSA